MAGINWKYKDDSKSRIFWSASSDCSLYLGELFIDFDFEFNQSIGERTSKFQLTTEQINYLIIGLEKRLDKLTQQFNSKVPLGITSITIEYKGKKFELFVKMSRNHSLIHKLIRFRKFLIEAGEESKQIIFWGGDVDSKVDIEKSR